MAIQVWDEQAQQYRGVELARYGVDGTLVEALVWVDGAYKQVWSRDAGGPLWVDDFTSPTLHERWTLIDGSYDPPGLSGLVTGPVPAPDFEVTIGLPGDRPPSFMLAVADFATGAGAILAGSNASGYYFSDLTQQHFYWSLQASDYAWSTVTLRRMAGMWTVHADGEPILGVDMFREHEDPNNPDMAPVEAPDPFLGQNLPLTVGGWEAAGGGTTKVLNVSYAEL